MDPHSFAELSQSQINIGIFAVAAPVVCLVLTLFAFGKTIFIARMLESYRQQQEDEIRSKFKELLHYVFYVMRGYQPEESLANLNEYLQGRSMVSEPLLKQYNFWATLMAGPGFVFVLLGLMAYPILGILAPVPLIQWASTILFLLVAVVNFMPTMARPNLRTWKNTWADPPVDYGIVYAFAKGLDLARLKEGCPRVYSRPSSHVSKDLRSIAERVIINIQVRAPRTTLGEVWRVLIRLNEYETRGELSDNLGWGFIKPLLKAHKDRGWGDRPIGGLELVTSEGHWIYPQQHGL